MPVNKSVGKFNKVFGNKAGSATEVKSEMEKRYGTKKGDQVFYALVNKRLKGRVKKGSNGN